MNAALDIRPLQPADHDAAARLIHSSLVHWYQSRLGQGERFGASHEAFKLFPEVYAALDPGEAVAAFDRDSGELIGVAFVHPRPTHIAVGIVAVAPNAQSRGVARAMMAQTIEAGRRTGRPVRLVSSLLNLDSFSLYSRLGFVPHTIYQDMCLRVPAGGMPLPPPEGAYRVRRLTDVGEANRLAQFEFEMQGLQRESDYAFFLQNRVGQWRVWVAESAQGELEGVLVASLPAACLMLGPGVALNEQVAAALLWRALDSMPGLAPVFLVPSSAQALVHRCYAWGARNVELHVAQTVGGTSGTRGIAFPTFLPETG